MRGLQPWRFFCVIAPGLEAEARLEWEEKRHLITKSEATFDATPGGFEITLPWEEGRGLAHVLKLPTRVLVRLTKFSARDFPKFFQRAKGLEWNQWLSHPGPAFKISAHQCRLMHTGRIEETLQDALKDYQKRQPFSTRYQKENIAPETIYVRGVDDEWSLSLDICGDALYKRGTSLIKGVAPMRETLAAFCLRLLFKTLPEKPIVLWDPMCGSGTLLLEALSHFTPTQRELSYQKSILNLGCSSWKPQGELSDWPILEAVGSDVNEEIIKKLLIRSRLSWLTQDFLKRAQLSPERSPLWIIANPPYGERIDFFEGKSRFFEQLVHSLAASQAERVLLITPDDWPVFSITGLNLSSRVPFSNGGIKVEARLWKKATSSR